MSNTVVVSVIGLDCPGVVYAISSTLSDLECNIEEVSQTILKGQFAAIFIVTMPPSLENRELERILLSALDDRTMHLSVTIRPLEQGCLLGEKVCEPFVVTVDGQDRLEIISNISGMFAEHRVNIENLKAIRPEEDPSRCLLVFEISLPLVIDRSAFRQTLQAKARDMGLSLSIQHRDIFEAVNRIPSV